jgi:hypothetical protein
MQIKLTEARRAFYVMNKEADSNVEYKFPDAQLQVNRHSPKSTYLLAHITTLQSGGLAM